MGLNDQDIVALSGAHTLVSFNRTTSFPLLLSASFTWILFIMELNLAGKVS